jgi:thiol-disulfide isomerase/thioredoxin
MKKILIFLLTAFVVINVLSINRIQSGIWQGKLQVKDRFAPFLFEVNSDSMQIILLNGTERVVLTGIKFTGDSLIIPVEAYDAVIKTSVTGDKMEGRFIKNFIENDPGILFKADYQIKNRFPVSHDPATKSIDGKWDVLFIWGKNDTTRNVGIFKSNEGNVTGSVLTNSGDLRFLEGNYTPGGVQLSAFSGLSPYLLEFTFVDENSFEGFFYTAKTKTRLKGIRNEKAGLGDPFSITKMKKGYEYLAFKLPGIDGKKISLNDEIYWNKVIVISILGSWCPNCLDEMSFLAPWYKANKSRGVEVLGLAFERKDELTYAQGTLSRLIQRFNTTYPILFGGKASSESIARALPEIEGFFSYPTTIFIDKSGKVRKIHTGFNGPATGLFYEEFQKEFNNLIDELLKE